VNAPSTGIHNEGLSLSIRAPVHPVHIQARGGTRAVRRGGSTILGNPRLGILRDQTWGDNVFTCKCVIAYVIFENLRKSR
jgi:hypothetical protein